MMTSSEVPFLVLPRAPPQPTTGYMYNYCENRTDTRLCEPLGSIRPNPSPESVH